MNILEALKKYIRANGGSSRANNISEAVKDLDSIPQGSGGGASLFIINLSVNPETNELTWDKTNEEMIEAYNNNQIMMVKVVGIVDGVFGYRTALCTDASDAEGYGYSFVFAGGGGLLAYNLPDGSDGYWDGAYLPEHNNI